MEYRRLISRISLTYVVDDILDEFDSSIFIEENLSELSHYLDKISNSMSSCTVFNEFQKDDTTDNMRRQKRSYQA